MTKIRDPMKIKMVKSFRFFLENSIGLIISNAEAKIELMIQGRYRRRRFRWPSLSKFRFKLNLGKWLFFLVVLGFLSLAGLVIWFSRDLPDPNKIVRDSGYSSVILDRTGKEVLYDIFVDQNRKFTPLADVPDYLRKATISIEDKDFYKHGGFDPLAVFRITKNLIISRRLIGGSTLTQQLVKNVLLTNERTITRKIREFVLSLRIEKRFTKDEILQMYLNEAPYGGTSRGVSSAAQMYFGKEARDLNLVESIILAGIPQAPTRYSPILSSHSKAYITRAREVARRMREDGYIDAATEKQVVESLDKVEFRPNSASLQAGHFVMYVKQQLDDLFGPGIMDSGGLKVTSTLDLPLQLASEKIVAEEIAKVEKTLQISNGASVIINPNNGEILSMVGSRGYFDKDIDGQVNVVTRLRQPGSSIKPLVYATAFSKGFTPATMLADVVTEFPGKDEKTPYIPKDYDGKEKGPVKLREALGSSLNVPAVKLLALTGVRDVLMQGAKMGIASLDPSVETQLRLGLSIALGGGEVRLLDLASAYGAFANGGMKVNPIAILKVEDKAGKVIYENKTVFPDRVIDEKVAFLINQVLSDNNARLLTFGVNSYLNLGSRAVAVKTGTTNDMRDNWTLGWSRDAVIGVWVGNNNNSQMKNVASGVSGAAPIWRREMLEVLSKIPDRPWDIPKGINQVEVDKISGYPAHDGFESYKEWFVEGTVPTGDDPIHKRIQVCKGQSEKLANAAAVASGNYDWKEIIVVAEKDPLTDRDLWQRAIDGWVATKSADPRFRIPTEYCESNNSIGVNITNPTSKNKFSSDGFEVRFDVFSDKQVDWAEVYLDDSLKQRITAQPYRLSISSLTNGNHKVRVVVHNTDNQQAEQTTEFAINQDWLSPTPSATSSATTP